MKQKITGIVQLTRYKEVVGNVVLLSVFALFLSLKQLNLAENRVQIAAMLIIVLAANILATTFAFMINDVEDADDDAMDARKSKRNPVSAGRLSKKEGYIISLAVAVLAMLLYASLSFSALIFGSTLVILGFLYSWKPLRLKGMPLIDIASHAYFLAGGILLTAHTAFAAFSVNSLLAFVAVYLISLAGDLYNEIRDFENDRKAKLRNTASIIGINTSKVLRWVFTVSGVLLALYIGAQLLEQFNTVALLAGICICLGLTIYSVFVSKDSISDLDNAFYFNSMTAIVSVVIAISIFY